MRNPDLSSHEHFSTAQWSSVAAPGSDLPSALTGTDRPDNILRAIADLETAMDQVKEFQHAVNTSLIRYLHPSNAKKETLFFEKELLLHTINSNDIVRNHPMMPELKDIKGRIDRIKRELSSPSLVNIEDFLLLYDSFNFNINGLEKVLRNILGDTWNRLANVDPLTGLGNRNAMLRKLAIECERHSRSRQPCCLAILDLDGFKDVNDTHGHAAGDVLLRSIASLLAASVRPYDEVFRYGGDEFVLCLPNADLRTAWAVVERLRRRIAKWNVPLKTGSNLHSTVSIGVAPLVLAGGVDGSLDLADRALYTAKRNGRNTLFVCSTPA